MLLVFLITIVACIHGQTNTRINQESRLFIDEYSRSRIFHGMNAVYKIAPWHPATSGFDATNTLGPQDAQLLKSWGMNIGTVLIQWLKANIIQ